jgi:hypothetical protein
LTPFTPFHENGDALKTWQLWTILRLLIVFIASRVLKMIFMQKAQTHEEMEAAFGQQLRDLRLRRNTWSKATVRPPL